MHWLNRTLIAVAFVFVAANSGWAGIYNNSGTTAEDSISIPLWAADTLGQPVDLEGGTAGSVRKDWAYVVFHYPSGKVSFTDSVEIIAATTNPQLYYDAAQYGAKANYSYVNSIDNVDGGGITGTYHWEAIVRDSSLKLWTPCGRGEFQLVTQGNFSNILDSSTYGAGATDSVIADKSSLADLNIKVNSSDTIGINWAAIANPTTSVALSGTTIADSVIVDKSALADLNIKVNSADTVLADIIKVDGNTTSAKKLKEMNRFLRKGVCAGTHTTTSEEILLDDSPIDDDDNNFYSGMQIMWLTGTNAGAVRRITQSSANSAGDHNLTVQPPLGQASIDGDSILILHNAELIFSQNGTFPSLLINARMTSAIDGAIDSSDIDANVYTYLAGLVADSTWRKGWAFATGTAATVGQGLDAIRDSTDEMAATSASSLDSVTVWRLLRRMFGLDVASGDTLTVAQRTVTDVSGVGGGSCGSGSQTVTLCVQDTSGTDEFVAQAHVSIYTDAARTSLYADPFTQTGGCQTLNLDASTTYYYSITRAGFTFDTNNFTTGSGGTWGDTLLGYNVVVGSPGSASLCRVYGYLSDGPNAIRHADVTLTLENVASGQVVVDTVADRTVAIRTFTVKTDANGYWYIDVVPNTYLTPPNTTYHYTASKAGVTLPGQEKSGLTVPTDATARIEDLF